MRIAFLTNELITNNPQRMWKGIIDTARAHGVDSVSFAGGYLIDQQQQPGWQHPIYSTIGAPAFDGVIIRGHISIEVSHTQEMAFYQSFHPLPCVVIGRKAEGIPHVIMDNYTGMYDAVSHMVTVHNRRRLAFFRGPQLYDAEERYRAYRDVLRSYEIPFQPELVTPVLSAWDSPNDINEAINYLLAQDTAFDTIIAASDSQAEQIIPLLQERGIRIPEDVAVVGFNNTGAITSPRLTTVDAQFYEQGKRGMEMLFSLMQERPVAERILVPTRLHVRQSCGCLDLEVVRAAAQPQALVPPVSTVASGNQTDKQKLAHLLQISREVWHQRLLEALLAEFDGAPQDHFLRTLERILRESASQGDDLENWHNRFSALREQLLAYLAQSPLISRVENLLHQSRVLIGQAVQWEEHTKRKDAQRRTNLLYKISQTLITTFDTQELMKVLAHELPRLNIPSAYISLYSQPDKTLETVRLMLAYDDHGRSISADNQPLYPVSRVVPDHLLPRDRTYSLVVEMLSFHDEPLGLAIFEVGPREGSVYDVLRGQISNALKGANLFLQNAQLYAEAREAQKSAEEANRLKSRFLASVSHELRTPINMLIGLSEMLLEDHEDGRPPLHVSYQQDIQRISTSARHLDDLLRDVLDLSRSQLGRLKLVPQPLDFANLLRTVAAVVEPIIIQKGLAWAISIPPSLPPVWGDAARLKQVLLNLIHNATKFTSQGGIVLNASLSNGEVTVSISDTGLGIPLDDQELIFDEFHTSHRAAARGYGGMGLGLAICRKLIEMHNGRMGVLSPGTEGSGSTFYFSLPIMTQYEAQNMPDVTPQQTVLLISEHQNDTPELERYLKREGFEVNTLHIDEQLPQHLPVQSDAPPEIVIMDMKPETPHTQRLIQLVKDHPAMREVPLLFYSMLQEQNAGAVFMLDQIAKPVGKAALARALARYGLEDQTTILIVDDDHNILDMHTNAVQAQLPGCQVIQADNGRKALTMIREHMPDLVLLDLMMPEMDGFDVLLAMQMDEQMRRIPAIVLTAMSLTDEDMARISQGAATILSKEVFNLQETLSHVESVLARNRHLGSDAQRIVRKVMVYIHQHYTEPISRRDMAAYAGVSERHLDRCFQQDMGITPVNYLNRYRVRQAKAMLRRNDRTLTEIALAVGFTNSSHFSRVFRREVGISPGGYQRGNVQIGQ